METNYLITWMYSPEPGRKIDHYQTGGDSDQQKTQNLYWRCLFCLFESSHRNNKNLFKHILYVNKMPPEKIDGIPISKLVRKYEIDIREFVPKSLPPKGYYKAWTTQFLLLDILKKVSEFVKPEDRLLLLDVDCIFSKPVTEDFLKDIDTYNALLYSIDYPEDRLVNGMSINMLRQVATEMFNKDSNELCYEGGEIICLKGKVLEDFFTVFMDVYKWSIQRFEKGLLKLNTEEHAFSVIYWQLGMKTFTANKYIKRLWTNLSSSVNLEPGDEQRLLWHLPGEKKHGFIKYFQLLGKNNYSLEGNQQNLPGIFRVIPSFKDKVFMIARIPFKKIYKMLKVI